VIYSFNKIVLEVSIMKKYIFASVAVIAVLTITMCLYAQPAGRGMSGPGEGMEGPGGPGEGRGMMRGGMMGRGNGMEA
jgi:hypothetical protein